MHVLHRHRLLSASILLAIGASTSVGAQVFDEKFDISDPMNPRPGCNIGDFPGGAGTYPFPVDWLKRNVDNRTPDAQVSYVNEAWEVREDFANDASECAAFSTSWYAPSGAADDWMWTPLITLPAGSSVLSWRAVAYDQDYADGYEVRAMVSSNGPPTGGIGSIGNQVTGSSVLFSVAAEQSVWTSHTVSLADYSGQQIYVGFRNNSNDKFVLLIDDVRVVSETPNLTAAATVFSSPYPRVAAGVPVNARLAVIALNTGAVALTNVVAVATVKRDGVAFGTPIMSNVIASLPIGNGQTVTFPIGHTFGSSGVWSVEYNLSADQTPSESNLADNVLDSAPTAIGGNEFARHDLPATSTLGIGAGNGGEIGLQFEVLSATTFDGIRFAMNALPPAAPPNPEWAGRPLVANLRVLDTGTGKPGNVLASTTPVTSTNSGGTYDALFVGGPQSLPAGSYVVTVAEPVDGPAMPLMMTGQRFEAGAGWVIWPTAPEGDWVNVELFGASFAVTPNISLLSELSLFRDGFEADIPASTESRIAAPERPLRKARPTRLVPVEPH